VERDEFHTETQRNRDRGAFALLSESLRLCVALLHS
jgi:hypothetical protein